MRPQPSSNQLASAAGMNRSGQMQGQPSSNPPPPTSSLDERTKLPMSPDPAVGRGGESSPQSSGTDATQGKGQSNRARPSNERPGQTPKNSEDSPKQNPGDEPKPMGEPSDQKTQTGQPMRVSRSSVDSPCRASPRAASGHQCLGNP